MFSNIYRAQFATMDNNFKISINKFDGFVRLMLNVNTRDFRIKSFPRFLLFLDEKLVLTLKMSCKLS